MTYRVYQSLKIVVLLSSRPVSSFLGIMDEEEKRVTRYEGVGVKDCMCLKCGSGELKMDYWCVRIPRFLN